MIKAKNLSPASAIRYVYAGIDVFQPGTAAITNALAFFVWPNAGREPHNPKLANATSPLPYDAKIVDIVIGQSYAGVGGTNYVITITKNGTAICSTNPTVTLAGGANVSVDAAGALALPTGWVRPILKTDSSILLKKGDVLSLTTTISGTYTTSANLSLMVVIDPGAL